eukprot:TRINITY_DN5086_c0_g2_i1.p1 TRINITY_DN5086_c0_g2~~TRINITY_DN5086_c0_g2_i1.p1  ORF type:complete len:493 (+),score=98.85 TRINITY_DN5086_c0_g2_i1:205-1683(+)
MQKTTAGELQNEMPQVVSEVIAAPPTPPSQLMVNGKGDLWSTALQSPGECTWNEYDRASRYSERCAGGTAPTPAPTPMKLKEPTKTAPPAQDGPDLMEQLASLLNDGSGIGGNSGSPSPECLDGLIIRPEKTLEPSRSSKGGNSLLASMLSAVPPTPFSTPARPLGTTPRKPISQSVPSSVSRKMFDDDVPDAAPLPTDGASAAFSMPPLLPMEEESQANGNSHPITNLSNGNFNGLQHPQSIMQQAPAQQVFTYQGQQPHQQQNYVVSQEAMFQAPPPPPPLFNVANHQQQMSPQMSSPQQMSPQHNNNNMHMTGFGVVDPPPLLQTAQNPGSSNFDPPPKNLMPDGIPVPVMVEFKMGRRAKFDGSSIIKSIPDGTRVIVKGDRGEHLGRLRLTAEVEEGESQGILIRTATSGELAHHAHHSEMEAEALETCSKKLHEYGLVMELCYAEYQFDLKKLTFFYRSDTRQDFRDLIRDLYKLYRARIWMEKLK